MRRQGSGVRGQETADPPGLLFLIGYRATGKSTVARLLAQGLGWEWADADAEIERRAGQTIREIFATEGEPGFRRRESAVLEELCGRVRCVVATGGGVVLAAANRALLRRSGRTVWLTADPPTIWQRLRGDPGTWDRRPNLTVGGIEEIEQLLAAREPFYRECADLTLDTVGRSPEELADAVLACWKPS